MHASVWPLELGLGTHNPRFGVADSVGVRDSQFTLRCGPSSWGEGVKIHASVWPLELGLGTHNPRFGVAHSVGVRDSQSTLRCGPSSWS